MEKVFETGSKYNNKKILVKIEDNFVDFFFEDDYLRDKQTENKISDGFYWFYIFEYKRNRKHWEIQLSDKKWYVEGMLEFIDENI